MLQHKTVLHLKIHFINCRNYESRIFIEFNGNDHGSHLIMHSFESVKI